MKFENTEVFNLKNAIRGMRNPLNSWDKSDSGNGCCSPSCSTKFVLCKDCNYCDEEDKEGCSGINSYYQIGENDLKLAKKLLKSSEQRKYLRQIFVSVDLTGPLYWWKEMDTYKVGTTANSTSTMHKLATTKITKECFEMDDFIGDLFVDVPVEGESWYTPHWHIDSFWDILLNKLEELRRTLNDENTGAETKKALWKEFVRLLPESWLQTRTWTANYEVLRSIYRQRKNHKLTEWHRFCEWVETLPYAKELIIGE